MLSNTKEDTAPTLLVYIPCHVDYQLAVKQAQVIRNSVPSQTKVQNFKIKIAISSNGVRFSDDQLSELKRVADHVVVFPFGIAGDINIALGFIKAIELEADFLWILSANDVMAENALSTIFNELCLQDEVDILVGASEVTRSRRAINSVFDSINSDLPLGLISAVVYRTKNLARNFDIGIQLNWTSWSQLAVIEAGCLTNGGITASIVNSKELYIKSERLLSDEKLERDRVRSAYAFSFMGMPALISILHFNNILKQRIYLNGWIKANWFLANFFNKGMNVQWHNHTASDRSWLKIMLPNTLKHAGFRYRLLFRFGLVVPLEYFREIHFFKSLRRIMVRK